MKRATGSVEWQASNIGWQTETRRLIFCTPAEYLDAAHLLGLHRVRSEDIELPGGAGPAMQRDAIRGGNASDV